MDARHLGDQHHAGTFALAVDVVGEAGRRKRRGGPSGQVGFRRGHGVRHRDSYLAGSGEAFCVAAASVRYSSVPAAPVIAICAGPPAPFSRVVHTGSAGLPSCLAALVDHPFHAVDVLRPRRIEVGVDGGDQLVLVGVALRQAQVHAAGRQIADGGADGADLLARRRIGAAAVDALAAAGVGLPAVGQPRQPDRDLEGVGVGLQRGRSVVGRRRSLARPARRETSTCPSTPASTMQASTSGAIDQNMSRPS